MSMPVHLEQVARPGLGPRLAALPAVGAARLLARLPPRRLRAVLSTARRGARAASVDDTRRARDAVVAASRRCAGQQCLQRSIACALLCRLRGTWPEWRTGVRTDPFRAHAWVAVDGRPVGEQDAHHFHTVIVIGPVRGAQR
jgi:hypothetical protein